jgi:small-conductance mechanosensitive channel
MMNEQKEILFGGDGNLQKMLAEFDAATPSERARLERVLTARRTMFEELRKTVQSLNQLMEHVMEQE